MGVNIWCAGREGGREIEMGYSSFMRLRTRVAHALGRRVGELYEQAPFGILRAGEWEDFEPRFCEAVDAEVDEALWPVVDFLWLPDCDGTLDAPACKALGEVLWSLPDEALSEVYGRAARPDAATLGDFAELVREGAAGDGIEWC